MQPKPLLALVLASFACSSGAAPSGPAVPSQSAPRASTHASETGTENQAPLPTETVGEGQPATPSAASAAAAEEPLEPAPTIVRALGPSVADDATIDAWVAARVAEARRGTRQYVRMPLAFASDGWGCSCPTHYVGGTPNSNGAEGSWIRIENASGQSFPEPPSEHMDGYDISMGQVVRVDGYFTGDVQHEDHRNDGGPPEWLYEVNVFRVIQIHGAMQPERAYQARVAALGEPRTARPCARVVRDDSPLNVRARPRPRANTVGSLPDGTRIEPVAWQGNDWIRIEAPVAGWIWAWNTVASCD